MGVTKLISSDPLIFPVFPNSENTGYFWISLSYLTDVKYECGSNILTDTFKRLDINELSFTSLHLCSAWCVPCSFGDITGLSTQVLAGTHKPWIICSCWWVMGSFDALFVVHLTHWGWDKMDAILQTFSNWFSCINIGVFWFKFHWNLFSMVQLTLSKYLFR